MNWGNASFKAVTSWLPFLFPSIVDEVVTDTFPALKTLYFVRFERVTMAAEPISLTVGVVALASLFSTCIECFDFFKAGQRLEEDIDILLIKLDLEKTRMLIWGNAVGILKAEDEGRAVELSEPSTSTLVGRCLERVQSLLSNTEDLQKAYGLKAVAEPGAI